MDVSDGDLKGLRVAREVDCQGESCPGPVLKAMEALEAVASGEVVVLTSDMARALENVRVAVETGGLAASLGVVEEGGRFSLYLRKA